MGLFLSCLSYALAGLLQEVMSLVYHRATATNRKILSSVMTAAITAVSLLVMTQIMQQILASGPLSLLLVLIFAAGRGLGAYITLGWWESSRSKNKEIK